MKRFLMVGEQRSGSNLLRVMINQSGAIAAPHPPHILQRMTPLLPFYGDLADDTRFAALVDDVCRLVEANPVAWEGVERFDRGQVAERCRERSLVAVFSAVMDLHAEANDRQGWLNKSMQDIRWAEAIDAYHDDARYLYLHRDGRDVALSFTKAVVGDKHLYHIARQWAELQRLCLAERERVGGRMFTLGYERLIADPEPILRELCDFLEVPFRVEMLDFHRSGEASRTADSSSLWGNLNRSLMSDNANKFLREFDEQQVRMIENVAGDALDALGYERVFVRPGEEQRYGDEEIAKFDRLNEAMKARIHAKTDPQDAERRRRQQAVIESIRERFAEEA